MTRIPGRSFLRGIALICSVVIAPGDFLLYGQGPPQTTATVVGTEQSRSASPQQLDSLVAPIALYPDALLAQVLAASTYPLEIVTASRWVKENSQLKGKALVEAAARQDWDPSVQALVAFPAALELLDQNLGWTTALGNMFLAQQADVMAAVQRMRVKAEQSGNLESNAQQQVQNTTVEGQPTVVIQSADPQVMYVPSYDPAAVYGVAPQYPYPALEYPAGPGIGFGLGVAVGAMFNGMGWGWGWGPMWGMRPSIFVNNNFFNHNGYNYPNRGNWGNAYRGNGNAGWQHNPRYRGGVAYPNRDVANRYNGGRGGLRPSQGSSNLGNVRPPGGGYSAGRGGMNRPGGGRPGQYPGYAGANRPGGGRPGAGAIAGQTPGVSPGNRGGAYRGAGAGQARPYGNRGAYGANRAGMGGNAFRGGHVRGGGYRGGAGMRRGGGGYRGGGGMRRGGGGYRGGGYRGGGRRR